ncbi:HIRAN domain-containing protein [Jiangella endophytica]|uniref:HIRAN domain-containing protein n=1 Tax=Jiangella endophytica TaxID=1623398 RepID=UPI001300B46A|nr:HIRAN domain-containing protein [Jiangella endophytica]
MRLLDRWRTTRRPNDAIAPSILGGTEDLEVVGEASYQEALWKLCGGSPGDRVRHRIVAVLVPEPHNQHDENAIAVHTGGYLVGYLTREVAAQYVAGLHALRTRIGGHVALHGVIVGGGYYASGRGRLGVWLDHDPADFGLGRGSPRPRRATGTLRTGFTEAWLTDVADDSYDLSWFDELPDADRPAIAMLRRLLETDPDPIDRHFQFTELESRLYRSRDRDESALNEFDDAFRRHDAEMDVIRAAFMAKWGKVPLLATYRQMAIRLQKQKDWTACVRWTERGLELYGDDAAREEAVEDLLKRRNRALAKLEAALSAEPARPTSVVTTLAKSSGAPPRAPAGIVAEIEILTCSRCATSFERVRVRGRKPSLCPDCRSAPA